MSNRAAPSRRKTRRPLDLTCILPWVRLGSLRMSSTRRWNSREGVLGPSGRRHLAVLLGLLGVLRQPGRADEPREKQLAAPAGAATAPRDAESGAVTPGAVKIDAQVVEFFETKVRPVLAGSCFECHGPTKQKSGLRVDSLQGLLDGGELGPAIVPGDPGASRLILGVSYVDSSFQMPPRAKLSDRQIEDLRTWVKMGAPWPGAGPKGDAGRSSAPRRGQEITALDREYWAFQPVRDPPPPAVRGADWCTSPLDRFLLAKLEAKDVVPNGPASPRELVRRAYFDLIGLPPPPEEVDAFVADSSPDAWARLVDRLLARPEHGERWARHWLDVVRYADSNGYERDDEKPLSWRYRDYVIRAFNEDKPYWRFVSEQLAGDELEDATAEAVAATGYYRLGVWDDEPDDARMAEFDYLDDILKTTGSAFLGLTVGCARCHDHKFDPIPQEDYYSLLAFIRNVSYQANPAYDFTSSAYSPFAPPAEVARWRKEDARKKKDLEARIAACAESNEKARLEADLKRLKETAPPFEWTLAVREDGPTAKATQVLIRGNAGSPGKDVVPAFLSVLGGERPSPPPAAAERASTGLRSVLGRWIGDPQHPLTARVIVNRVWQHHFGRGIVETSGDFGRSGFPPTHPELLDWLASRFIESGGSLKQLHRLILTSSAYRMSSSAADNAAALRADEGNQLFWRQSLHRLDAEAIRDSILAASGVLNGKMGGRGMFPRVGKEVLAGGSRPGLGWGVSSEAERSRRSIYVFVKRTMLDPFLEGFDYSNTAQPLDVRPVTTVAPQALTLLNSSFVDEEARSFARRLRREAGHDARAQVDRAYRLALARDPGDEERRIALDFLAHQERLFRDVPPELTFAPALPTAVASSFLAEHPAQEILQGPRDGWSYYRGRWGDGYEGIVFADLARGPFALWDPAEIVDARLDARFRIRPASEAAGFLLRARASKEGLFGYEVFIDLRTKRLSLRRHAEKSFKVLAEREAPIAAEQPIDLGFEARGGKVSLWLGSAPEPFLEADDSAPFSEAGRAGVLAWGSPLHVEDLRLRTGDKTWDIAGASRADGGSPVDRALDAFARVVLNLNEFVYVD